jgi:hypothetical protein
MSRGEAFGGLSYLIWICDRDGVGDSSFRAKWRLGGDYGCVHIQEQAKGMERFFAALRFGFTYT